MGVAGTCRDTWHDFEGEPPCAKCRPALLPANATAVEVYSRCSGQLIMGPGGAVDINVLAVLEIMELYETPDPEETLEKVQLIAGTVIRLQHEEAERRRREAQRRKH